jgi:hypothetical protein
MANGPPELFDLEAEKSLLGALFLEPDAVLEIPQVQSLRATDFWLRDHRRIWAAIRKLRREGREVDVVTVLDQLRRLSGGNGNKQDQYYLPDLITATPTWRKAGEHAAIVKDWARQREAQDAISDLGAAFGGDGRFENALDNAIDQLSSIQAGDDFASWPIRTLADAYAPREPLTYAIEGLFAQPSLSIAYGAPGTFKTLLLTEAALCVAAGQPWLESLPGSSERTARATVQMPVLWLDFDNGTRRMDERVEALAKERNLDPGGAPFYYTCMPTPWLDASSYSSTRSLAKRINDLLAGLVVIDNLGVIAGDADENSAEMAAVMGNLRRCVEETDAAMVVIHHQNKSSGHGRPGDALRGHTSIEAALDLALHVERDVGSDVVTIKSTKTRGADVYPFGALWTYEHKDGTESELARARFWGQEIDDKTSDAAIEDVIIDIVSTRPGMTRGDLVESAGESLDVGRDRIRSVIKRLVNKDEITTRSGKHNAIEHYPGTVR